MSYAFVAAPDHWSRGGTPIKAIAIHMAEGGGTVSWLTRDDGNSSHYVVEYSGRIVQMVQESRAAGSINPTELRRTDDPAFTFEGERVVYGYTIAKKVLGDHWSDPNAAVIAIEVEGFALDGPNPKQRSALKKLVADIRTRHPRLPALGHRDFQNYKRCPGKFLPWPDYGGHGVATDIVSEDNMGLESTLRSPLEVGSLSIAAGTDAIRLSTGAHYTVPQAVIRPAVTAQLAGGAGELGFYVDLDGDVTHFIRASQPVVFTPAPSGDDGIGQDQVDAAYAAGVEDGVLGEQERVLGVFRTTFGL